MWLVGCPPVGGEAVTGEPCWRGCRTGSGGAAHPWPRAGQGDPFGLDPARHPLPGIGAIVESGRGKGATSRRILQALKPAAAASRIRTEAGRQADVATLSKAGVGPLRRRMRARPLGRAELLPPRPIDAGAPKLTAVKAGRQGRA